MLTFQQIIQKLNNFWSKQGCVIGQPYGLEVGAGTANPNTFFRVLGPEPFSVAYVEPSRRPQDGRYGENPNRFQHYFQYQIILKPAPIFNQELYIESLMEIGIDPTKHDLRFVEDNWESIPLGAWGLGWEVWLDGMEITQYTYFQQMAGISMEVPPLEITFGLERIAMYIQGVDDYRELMWNKNVKYADLFQRHEFWQSKHNYESSNIASLNKLYSLYEQAVEEQLEAYNYWAAYDSLLKVSHTFNLLDARGAISLSDRIYKFKQMQKFSKAIGGMYLKERKDMKFPLFSLKQAINYIPPAVKTKKSKVKSKNLYVLELNFEEIPAEYLSKWSSVCSDEWLNTKLEEVNYTYKKAKIYFSPRRVVVEINSPAKYAEDKQVIWGPPVNIAYVDDKPSEVLKRFLKKNGATLKDVQREQKNGKGFVKIIVIQRTQLREIIQQIVDELIKLAPQQKFMRWDNNEKHVFIRPLRSIISYHNKEKININCFDIVAGNVTYGPRYYQPTIATINSAQSYLSFIEELGIKLDEQERQTAITKEMGRQNNYQYSDHMIEENVFLTELPILKYIPLDKRFKKLPYELVEKVLEKHQRYIIRQNKNTKEIEYGVVVNGPKATSLILDGNKKVANARLDDGLFYYNLDKDIKLESLRPKLSEVGFHPKAGTYLDKTLRIQQLLKNLYKSILKKSVTKELLSATKLIKNDKATNLGAEFPDLEGYIGQFLAREQGVSKKVSDMLFEHYLPRSINDNRPSSKETIYLSLVDKLDSLVALSAVEGFPEGNDPYEIRKYARNLLELIVLEGLDLDLGDLVEFAYSLVGKASMSVKLFSFLNKRFYRRITKVLARPELNNYLRGVAYSEGTNYYNKAQFARELVDVLADKETADTLFDAIKRVHNILKSAASEVTRLPEKVAFADTSEKAIYKFIQSKKRSLLNAKDLQKLAGLLDVLFESVMIMDKDEAVRNKRFGLLNMVNEAVKKVYKYE